MSGTRSDSVNQPLFYFHVPKTGGTTIIAHVLQRYGREKVLRPKKNKAFLTDIWLARKCKYKRSPNEDRRQSVVGHFASLSIIAGRELAYRKVCFWRHPAGWALSYYNWRRQVETAKLQRAYSLKDLVWSFARNPMTQDFLLYCGDVPGWRYFLMSDQRKFEAAVSLAKRFDVFADISEVDAYLKALSLVNGAAIERQKVVLNKALKILNPETQLYLERWNPVDYYVHLFSMARDKASVIAEARGNLNARFPLHDVIHLFARPYYRLKVKLSRS